VRFRFIDECRGRFAVNRMRRLLGVSSSGYYAWRGRTESRRLQEDKRLLGLVKEIHQQSRCSYGSPRVWRELRWRGETCGQNRIARLMHQNGLQSVYRRKWKPKGRKAKLEAVADNLLDGDFTTDAPNRAWTADITYVPTGEGWLFLAVVMDLFSRLIVGWAMNRRATRYLVIEALRMAVQRRRPDGAVIHHSDRGTQYGSFDFQKELEVLGVTCSMSGTGNCFDNAATESFFSTLKVECIQGRRYCTREQARSDLFDWIEGWYNRRRRHSYLDYQSPEEFERNAAMS
jgi:transposase InsO family protein